MKKTILILLAVILLVVTTAQSKTPKDIGGFEVLGIKAIYRVSARLRVGPCYATYYWWVDEWGRPVNFENYAPSTPIQSHEMLERYLDSLEPDKIQVTPFQSTSEREM